MPYDLIARYGLWGAPREPLTFLAAAGTVLSAGAGIAGAKMQSDAAAQQGEYQARVAEMQALALQQEAQQKQAAAQREMITREKQKDLLLSRQQAVAAASGGGATDPTILQLMGTTAGQGEYNALSALYEGDVQAQSLNYQADIERYKAMRARQAIGPAQSAALLSGVSSFGSALSGLSKVKWG